VPECKGVGRDRKKGGAVRCTAWTPIFPLSVSPLIMWTEESSVSVMFRSVVWDPKEFQFHIELGLGRRVIEMLSSVLSRRVMMLMSAVVVRCSEWDPKLSSSFS